MSGRAEASTASAEGGELQPRPAASLTTGLSASCRAPGLGGTWHLHATFIRECPSSIAIPEVLMRG